MSELEFIALWRECFNGAPTSLSNVAVISFVQWMREADNISIRSQVAELQRQLSEYDRRIIGVGEVAINSVSRDAYDGALEAESKLDEAAKQEPVAYLRDDNNDHNLPAMIEQARAEEREACAKACDDIVHSQPNWRGEGAEHCAIAIRAMGEKK